MYFGNEEVEYLGHIISKERFKVDLNKINVIMEIQKPKNILKAIGFLGLTMYYRRFIKNYAYLKTPLSNLLNKNFFQRVTKQMIFLRH